MNNLTTEIFFTEYNLMMDTLDKEFCLGCEEKYKYSSKYHTCKIPGDKKYNQSFRAIYGTYNSQDMYKAIELVLRPYSIYLNRFELIVIFDWIIKREIANTHSPIRLFREILNNKIL